MNTELWLVRPILPDRLPIRHRFRKPRTTDYCKPRHRYPIGRYRPRYTPRCSLFQLQLQWLFQRIQTLPLESHRTSIETPSETDSEESEAIPS